MSLRQQLLTFHVTVVPSSAASSSPRKKVLDPEVRMHHDPPKHFHISTDFSLQVKLTIFPHPRKHLPSLLSLF